MIYAHGGGGYNQSDGVRVGLFRQEGFATVAFDAFKLHGLDGSSVNTRYSNLEKQDMIIATMKVAYDYGLRRSDWDTKRIVLYGQSNGGRVVLCFPSLTKEPSRINGILAEAPAGSDCQLPDDLGIPTRLFYGKKMTGVVVPASTLGCLSLRV